MSTTNEILLPIGGHLERLDLDGDTNLLPTFQANDRTKPETIQSDYSPEFSVPGTAANHRRLKQAAAGQPLTGAAYVRVPCILISGGVETLPLGLLYIKSYTEGRYYLQLSGGNRRFVEALGEKKLSDLDFSRFNHTWTPANITAGLTYGHWAANGWGYSLEERGKPLDLQDVSPFVCYPCVAGSLIWRQIITDAGWTADSLLSEPLFAKQNVPTANPYAYPQEFRDARALQAGMATYYSSNPRGIAHDSEFPPERLPMEYTGRLPYRAPTAGATYNSSVYTADTLGYYDLVGSARVHFYCDPLFPGRVSCKVMLYVNGQPVYNNGNQIGQDESGHVYDSQNMTLAPKLERYLLNPNDTVELYWQGDEWDTLGISPSDPNWQVGNWGAIYELPDGRRLDTQVTLRVTLLEEFPEGGLVRLQEWLPKGMTQLDFVKTQMLLLGLTIQADRYDQHLYLAPGTRLLQNVPRARDWTTKRHAYAGPGRLPERDLAFRFGSYGQANLLKWKEDASVTPGYGDGRIDVADEALPTTYELATLPFAASELSKTVAGLLYIANFEAGDFSQATPTYSKVDAQPRLMLRDATPAFTVQIGGVSITTTANYFAGVGVSLLLNGTVLGSYWGDLRAMLDQARYLTEYYRLTPQDIAGLDYSIPIWDGGLGDYFAVSAVGEYDARRPVEVRLARLNAAYLPAPTAPGAGAEFYGPEFYTTAEYF